MNASDFSDDDNWLPFGSEDIPSDDEPHLDSDLPSDDEPEDESKLNEMPQIEETPPPPEKKPKPVKAEKAPSVRESAAMDKDREMVDRYLDDLFPRSSRPESKPTSKKATSFPAPKRGGGAKKNKAVTPEEVAKHMVLLLKIDKYRTSQRYAECLARSRLPLQDADDMSIEELEQLLTRIGVVINNQNSGGGGALSTGIVFGATAVEKSAFLSRFANLDGYAASLAHNEEFNDLCEQLSINYSILDNIRPEFRLAICLGKHAMTVNGLNTMKARLAGAAPAQPTGIGSAPVAGNIAQAPQTSGKPGYQEPIYDL